jgi:hypothetical protein
LSVVSLVSSVVPLVSSVVPLVSRVASLISSVVSLVSSVVLLVLSVVSLVLSVVFLTIRVWLHTCRHEAQTLLEYKRVGVLNGVIRANINHSTLTRGGREEVFKHKLILETTLVSSEVYSNYTRFE